MRNLKDESGQAMVIAILAMICLMGFVALAADMGVMFREKRLVQTAADAAAIAGASEINYGDVSAAGVAAATQNGFTPGANTVVNIYSPPIDGPHTGAAGYVEATITQTQSTLFMKLFQVNSMNVFARAVAENGGSSQGCVYVLSPNASDAMDLQGSFDVSAPTCGIVVDSNSSSALQFTGAGGTLTAGSVGVVGGVSGQSGDSTPPAVTGIAPESDPLGYVSPPAANAAGTQVTYTPPGGTSTTVNCTAPPSGKGGGTTTLTGTLTATAGSVVCYSGNVTLSNVVLANATYVFTGSTVTMGGSVSSVAAGSTIDINAGTLSINTGTTLGLIAPTSGAYNGIALMQPLANTNQITIQKGDASGSIYGIIYAPGAELYLQDSGGDKSGGLSLTTDLIVGTLYDKTATLSIASYSQTVGTSPLTRVALVE